jgi:hypothetical protein
MIKSVVLLTFHYHGKYRLESSTSDAYHTLQWAQRHHLPVTWYVDQLPSYIFDPIIAAFFATQSPRVIDNIESILRAVPSYSMIIITGHGHQTGLYLTLTPQTRRILPWNHLLRSLVNPDLLIVIDCCHVPLLLPAVFTLNKWSLSGPMIRGQSERCYIISSRHPQGEVISSPGGSPLLNHVLMQLSLRHHRWDQWISDSLPHDLTMVINTNYTILETLPSWILTPWHFLYDYHRRLITSIEV